MEQFEETPEGKVVDLPLVLSVHSPCFRTIEQCGEDDSLVDFKLDCKADPSPIPDVSSESPKINARFGDSVVDLGIHW